jgi:hypothetical protein
MRVGVTGHGWPVAENADGALARAARANAAAFDDLLQRDGRDARSAALLARPAAPPSARDIVLREGEKDRPVP